MLTPALLGQIEALYRELPTVHCKGCGRCCVSPTCTLAEFIYLAATMNRCLQEKEINSALTSPVQLHKTCEGNIHCLFLKNGTCTIHPSRTGACRLFGIPSLEKMNINDLVVCTHAVTATGRNVTKKSLMQWLRRIIALNLSLFPLGTPPYFIIGMNLECWFDIYFDEPYPQPFFSGIQKTMAAHLDLSRFAPTYRQRTGIRKKIEAIDQFTAVLDCGDPALLQKHLLHIRDDFPQTGTYFFEEANRFLTEIATIQYELDTAPP